jgi:CO/xanthine dehydrogenase Mo-binding subunit
MWLSTQAVHGVRDQLCRLYELEPADVRVVAPDVGGGFGPKIDASAEELLLPWIARRLQRPVRWHETRAENMLAMGHGRGQVQTVELGGRSDGRVLAYRLHVVADGGAYPTTGAWLPYLTRLMAPGVYDIAAVEVQTTSVATNTNCTVAYRGAGRPEATAAIERAMDLFARAVELDPAEVRRRNFIAADRFPHTTPTGATYDCGDYERALDLVLEAAGYAELRAEQARRRADGDERLLGIGVSSYVEVTAGPSAGNEHARIEVRDDGSAVVYTGVSPHGQGHHTSLAMIASDQLGIPIERIAVVHGDTAAVPEGGGTMGSRSLQLGGSAVLQASGQVIDRARELAAEMFEAAVDDVVLDRSAGRFHVSGVPAISHDWGAVAASTDTRTLAATTRFQADAPTYPFGAHVAVVEIDAGTGQVRLQRVITVDDAGRVLNPLLVEGQRHGGIAQGAAQALYEEMRYDEDGNPQTANLADYAMVSAAELPFFELVEMETPTPLNPLGAKGVGESGTIGSTPAVHNAVIDAVSHLGVTHIDMPCTPFRVWEAIRSARAPEATP